METIKYFTSRELQSVLKACTKDESKHSLRNLCLLKTAFYCGLRASELGLIRLDDYNPSNRDIYCRRLKGSNNNTVRLDVETSRLLNKYIKEYKLSPGDLMFASQHKKPISRQTLDVIIKNYCKLAKIKDYTKHHFHVLKHTRAVSMLEAGFTLEDIQYVLGHKNISNTSIYAQFSSNYKRYLFDKMDRIKY